MVLTLILIASTFSQLVSAQNGLSEADIQELVDAHNMFRSMVDPPASNMLRIVSWDMCACVNMDVYFVLCRALEPIPSAVAYCNILCSIISD